MYYVATPESIAAFAIATGRSKISLGSNGVGIMYSRPKTNSRPGIAFLTESGTGYLASSAKAIAAAVFISSLIYFALTSRVALNKNGKHITLLIWLG